MELVTILATVILMATLITLLFSFAAYFITRAKRLRRDRKAKASGSDSEAMVDSAPPASPSQRGQDLFERYKPGQSRQKDKGDNHDRDKGEGIEDNQWM